MEFGFSTESSELLLGLMVGIGLAAACGFRVFVPLLVASVAGASGHLSFAPGFEWMGSPVAMTAFGIATVVEISGYYFPWVDNALDTLATPAAIVAGSLVATSMITDVSPFLQWSLGVIVGGGAAAATQVTTVAVRGASSVLTGGLGNPLVATAEIGGATGMAVLAIVWPVLVVALLILLGVMAFRQLSGMKTLVSQKGNGSIETSS